MSNTSPYPETLRAPVGPTRSAFTTAPLPVPVFDQRKTPTQDSREWDTKIGVLVHQIIGRIAPMAQALPIAEARVLAAETVSQVVSDRGLGNLAKARLRALGMTVDYLEHYLPGRDALFLGTELVTGAGRVDLAWEHVNVGVWFDELKTWRHRAVGLDTATWSQVRRYTDAGGKAFGFRYAGLRVLTLGQRGGSTAFGRDGLNMPLAGSSLDPAALRVKDAA